MDIKRVQFRVEITAFPAGSGGGLHGISTVEVEIFGGTTFHGLTVSHLDGMRATPRHQFHVISRTSVGKPGYAPDVITTDRYEMHILEDHEPILAADQALEHHLVQLLPADLGDPERIPAAIKEDAFYRMSYRDQVVEPIKTAVLGMCREPGLLDAFNDGDLVWAVGSWKLRVGAPRSRDEILALGTQVQDVLVVNNEHRGTIQQYLL